MQCPYCQILLSILLSLVAYTANAQTPIIIGDQNVETATGFGNAGEIISQAASLNQAATLTSLSFYVRFGGAYLILGVYDASGPNGGPGNLIAQTASATVWTTGWLTLATPQVLLQPGMYWLAYAPNNIFGLWVDRAAGQTVYASRAFGQMPSVFPSATTSITSQCSFYATLTSQPAPSPSPTPSPTPSPSPSPTPTPGQVTLTPGQVTLTPGQVTLAWSAPSTITGYEVSYGTTDGGPYPNIVNAGLNLTVTLTGLTSGTTYYAIVQSYDVNGNLSCTLNQLTFTAP